MSAEGTYVLGIDSGGTKTAAWCADAAGHVVGDARGGPANRFTVDPERLARTVRDVISGALPPAPRPVPLSIVCVVGPAGQEVVERVSGELARAGTLARPPVVIRPPEPEAGLVTVTPHRSGVSIVAGTGSSAWGATADGREWFTGGWGAWYGDEGSGYWIVREAIRRAAQAEDGRGPATVLVDRFCRELGVSRLRDGVGELYRGRFQARDRVAAWCPIVADAARGGDAVAAAVWRQAATELGLHAAACAEALAFTEPVPCACSGGLFRARDLLWEPLCAELRRRAPLLVPVIAPYEPVAGAVLLALRRLHGALSEALIARVGGRGASLWGG
ncbi:MAG TPA: BadF/BadG/BcrA/BcrD ATPase family protein [Limnochordia bacterium]